MRKSNYIWEDDEHVTLSHREEKGIEEIINHYEETRDHNATRRIDYDIKDEHRKQRRVIVFFRTFFIVIASLFFLFTLVYPPFYQTTFTVSGNEYVSPEYIESLTFYKDGFNYVYVLKPVLENQLEASPYIEKATVTKTFPNQINIAIDENEPLYSQYENGEYYIVFEDGFRQAQGSGDLPIMVPVLTVTDPDMITAINEQMQQLPYDVTSCFSMIVSAPSENDPNLLNIYTNDGSVIEISIDQIAEKLIYYPNMSVNVHSHYGSDVKGIYYLDVGNYFKPY